MQQQNGYVMVFVLFFLCCMLLCGSVLTVNLSEQFAASNEAVQKEQSRMLARSGWNLALEQLQLYGLTDAIQSVVSSGEIAVFMEPSSTAIAAWNIEAEGTSGVYHRKASGTVQCFPFPFAGTEAWAVIDTLAQQEDAGILLLNERDYQLSEHCSYPLGITSVNHTPMLVAVNDTITVSELYIYGDLIVNEALTADAIYVTGTITGADLIQCDTQVSGYSGAIPYQIRVLERTIT